MIDRTRLFGGLILVLVFLIGPLWCFLARALNNRVGGEGEEAMIAFALLHAILQFLPWAAVACSVFRTETDELVVNADVVDRENGLLWEVHVAYTIALIAAAPFLSTIGMDSKKGRGTFRLLFFIVKSYGTSILHAYDQYSDGATAVRALLQDWYLAVPMVVTFWFAYIIQMIAAAITAYYAGGESGDAVCGAFLFVAGVKPGAFAAADLDEGVKHGAMAMALVKFLTENLPQAILGLMLASDQTGVEKMLTNASVTLSLVSATKAFLGAAWFFMPDYAKSSLLNSEPVVRAQDRGARLNAWAVYKQENKAWPDKVWGIDVKIPIVILRPLRTLPNLEIYESESTTSTTTLGQPDQREESGNTAGEGAHEDEPGEPEELAKRQVFDA